MLTKAILAVTKCVFITKTYIGMKRYEIINSYRNNYYPSFLIIPINWVLKPFPCISIK
jgi:hypothetical protein